MFLQVISWSLTSVRFYYKFEAIFGCWHFASFILFCVFALHTSSSCLG